MLYLSNALILFMFDVSMGTPLLIRWPGHIKPGSVTEAMVQNIDFAPTMLDMARVPVPPCMQGKSLQPIVTGKQKKLARAWLHYRYYEFEHSVIPQVGIEVNAISSFIFIP